MNISPIALEKNQVLYEQVAERLQALITEGTLKPGDRLPSVRKLREQLSVSTSTVLEAYRLLEDRGLITARPQSGYYVKQAALSLLQEPAPTAPPRQAHDVDITLGFHINSTVRDQNRVELGAAFPAMELLPLAQINRLMGKIMREDPEMAHAYGPPLGCIELRTELARRMLNCGCSIAPDQLIVTNGTNEAMYCALQAITPTRRYRSRRIAHLFCHSGGDEDPRPQGAHPAHPSAHGYEPLPSRRGAQNRRPEGYFTGLKFQQCRTGCRTDAA
ncbi:MAG: GntR family transcriptional regulator [Cyanobacteria bacterium P01_A01_bin.70]